MKCSLLPLPDPCYWGTLVELNQILTVRNNSSPPGASLVVQWLRIRLPMQGTRVQALVREDPTCRGATKPASHNY